MKGKAYGNRKPEKERPENDFYQTPSCMVRELVKTHLMHEYYPVSDNGEISILDPCCGKYAIAKELAKHGYTDVTSRDLVYGNDFLKDDLSHERYQCIVMNPPFKLFNRFVEKAKDVAPVVFCIGKLNFFGAHDRNVSGLWNHLEWVLPFDRQIAFDKPEHEDGKVEMGMMVSGWFIWNQNYCGFPKIRVLDMQQYAWHKRIK